MSRNRVILGVGLLAVALVVSVAVPAIKKIGRTGESVGVPVYEVERGDFIRRIHAEGNLKAVDATLLGPPPEVSQPLKIAWLAPDGTPVKRDEVVVRFDPTDMEEDLREGVYERKTTDSKIQQKEIRDLGDRRNLERDAEMAVLELDYAQSFQSKDARIFSRTEIIESEIDQKLATQRKDHAQQAGTVQAELAQAELDLLTIERRKAEIKIDQAKQGLQGLEVQAPHDGIFVLKGRWGRQPEVGQVVWGGNPIAEIPKLEKMEAEVYVLEADAGGLEVGLPATVTLDAHPDEAYRATVRKVAALAQRRNNKVPIQYFNVTLELERTDPELMKPGQRVQSVLSLDEREDVLSIPRQAVFEDDDKKIVYVRKSGAFEPREVVLGPAGLGRVVIESGLEAGDRIALRDPTRPMDDGDAEQTDDSNPVGT